MPSDFLGDTEVSSYVNYEYPEYFDKYDIENIKFYENDTITRGLIPTQVWFDFNPDVNYKIYCEWWLTGNMITVKHVAWELWIYHPFHLMHIINETYGSPSWHIDKELAVEMWDSDANASRIRPVYCSDISVTVWLSDTNTTRNDMSDAWDSGTLNIALGFGYDDYTATLTAWDIVGRLLTFQSPEIFGMTGDFATVLNVMIGLPVWVMTAYLVYILILKAIPFLSG